MLAQPPNSTRSSTDSMRFGKSTAASDASFLPEVMERMPIVVDVVLVGRDCILNDSTLAG